MIPGEIKTDSGNRELNVGREQITVTVANSGDRPIQVGSHYHFYEVNRALIFERAITKGYRLDITSSTAVRFEPGQEREVTLIPYRGKRRVFGFRGDIQGDVDGKKEGDK
ncbi:urease subunit beta [Psychrosphaera saromensis]|uniref:Urease subunit beta n=1 Tax=Psychrosphaera saromensis TaxID=716813 RepID=A0A2S7URA5_9GAMM|nr:urease subunit beta [Psychrosphaera saromensis]PQJ52506.1 urease subunit beta [Psychrosphaera saromensis]GHB69061.1 urease subunit beta [Psychrosphaera saromensis]GLQ12970.1 urease subunit beta [Psychrosphaera saromensis]